jgi:large subunit ribosomal protein L4
MSVKNLTIDVLNAEGKPTSKVELDADIFGVKPDASLLHLAQNVHQANRRLGLAHTKTKGEVRGGGKKPWKQKGTGQARTGSIRNPQWRGGGVTFGPRTGRNWEQKLNVKAKRKALAMALSDKVAGKRFKVLEELPQDGKSKSYAKLLKALKLERLTLLAPASHETVFVRATRNMPQIFLLRADSLNTYDILRAHDLILPLASLQVIRKTYFQTTAKPKAVKV